MINFVIITDVLKNFKNVREVILSYMMKNNHEFNIVRFNTVEGNYLENDSYNIYIIDSLNASLVAKEIRINDWKSPIIILRDNKLVDIIVNRLQILDIVEKDSNMCNNLYELFNICFRQLKINSSFKYKIGKVHYTLDYNKILYIYKDTIERKSIIITDSNEYRIPMTLSKIYKLLPRNFAYSHKSCIVNLDRIEAFNWCKEKIVFDNGTSIELLSKSHKDELISQSS